MRVNCYFCGHPQEVREMDDLLAQKLARGSRMRGKAIRNIKWKYVCSDCTKTKKYREWAFTNDARGHMALTEEAKVTK